MCKIKDQVHKLGNWHKTEGMLGTNNRKILATNIILDGRFNINMFYHQHHRLSSWLILVISVKIVVSFY
jgi:hypothetical protein